MISQISQDISRRVRMVVGEGNIPALHEPVLGAMETARLKECIDSGFVSSVGAMIGDFEKLLSDYTGSAYVAACVNGTAALHISYLLAGVTRSSEVLMPALTFVATANAASYIGAVPHFVDVSPKTLGVDPEKLATYLETIAEVKNGKCINKNNGRHISALVVMHAFGHPAEIDELIELCQKYCIELVEDAAESLGSLYKGTHTGTRARVGATSFNGNKIITTGGGGAIFCQNKTDYERAKYLTTTSKQSHPYEFVHDEVGFNYRMPNLNAALGIAQMGRLPSLAKSKRTLADQYLSKFAGCPYGTMLTEPSGCKSNYWLNTFILNENIKSSRNEVIEHLIDLGIAARPAWRLLSRLKMYTESPKMDLAASLSLEQRIINLPSSATLCGTWISES